MIVIDTGYRCIRFRIDPYNNHCIIKFEAYNPDNTFILDLTMHKCIISNKQFPISIECLELFGKFWDKYFALAHNDPYGYCIDSPSGVRLEL